MRAKIIWRKEEFLLSMNPGLAKADAALHKKSNFAGCCSGPCNSDLATARSRRIFCDDRIERLLRNDSLCQQKFITGLGRYFLAFYPEPLFWVQPAHLAVIAVVLQREKDIRHFAD
jgi:hypothetical protein